MSFQKSDAKFSRRAFEKFSRHALQHFFGDGAQIHSFENHANELEKILDFSGLDGLIVRDGTIYFFASRCQFGRNYQSFSLRGYRKSGAATEFDKLKKANKIHAVMPAYHVQCFVDAAEQAATVAIAKTLDLLRFAEEKNAETRRTSTGEIFFVVPWRELERKKVYRVAADGCVEDLTAEFSASCATVE